MPVANRNAYVAGQQIAKRLDVLDSLQAGYFGISWWFVRVFLVAGGAWAMAAGQTQSYAYLINSIQDDFRVSSARKALIMIGTTMLGAFVGAFGFGSLTDTRGRKFSLLVSFTLTHAAGALCAASPNAGTLILLRFIVGIGLGGQQPIICVLIMEIAPTNIRGRALVYLNAFWPIGDLFAVLFSREIEPSIGWRAVSALSAGALLYLSLLYYYVPESPKWLATSGKIDDAVRVLRSIEEASSVFHGEEADDAIRSLAEPHDTGDDLNSNGGGGNTKQIIPQTYKLSFCTELVNRVRILLQYPYLARTLMLWFVWSAMATSTSGMYIYMDKKFIKEIADTADRTLLVYSVLAVQLTGNISACALIDRIGRRYTLICFLLAASSSSIFVAYLDHTMLTMVLLAWIRNFGFMGATGCLFAYTTELYPTSIRVIGISYAWGISRIGNFTGPYAILWMEGHLHMSVAAFMWFFCGVTLCIAAAIFVFGIETVNHNPEKPWRRTSSMATDHLQDDTSRGLVIAYQRHEDSDAVVAPITTKSSSVHFII